MATAAGSGEPGRGKRIAATDEVELAAIALAAGLDPWRVLTQTDGFGIAVIQLVLARALELQDMRDQNLAIRIANALGKVLR
jgi:hypothetical protein